MSLFDFCEIAFDIGAVDFTPYVCVKDGMHVFYATIGKE